MSDVQYCARPPGSEVDVWYDKVDVLFACFEHLICLALVDVFIGTVKIGRVQLFLYIVFFC